MALQYIDITSERDIIEKYKFRGSLYTIVDHSYGILLSYVINSGGLLYNDHCYGKLVHYISLHTCITRERDIVKKYQFKGAFI